MSISEDNEVLNSPFSRVYFCHETEQIINCAMGLKHPIDIQSLKKAFSNSILIKHPRFCSLIVRNPNNNGGVHWKETHVNIDDHFIIIHDYKHHSTSSSKSQNNDDDIDIDNDEAVNAYLADIAVSTSLSENKPLWEVHVLVGLKCVVLRVHHALGDGVSLMAMLSTCFGDKKQGTIIKGGGDVKVDNDDLNNVRADENKKSKRGLREIWGLIKRVWYTFIYCVRLLGRTLWVSDEVSVLSGGDGVELWPRKLVTAKFNIQDFKCVKNIIPNATVNDVLLGIISYGLSKYLEINSPKAEQQERLEVTAILIVNLRQKETPDLNRGSFGYCGIAWGNKTGLVLVPIICSNGLHPLDHVRAMKATMDKKKHSYEPHLSHWALKVIASHFGPKVASLCCHKVLCNSTLLISNIMGPSEEIVVANNPVTSMRLNISSQPQAMTMHMVSYAGKAELQVMVAKDIISNPEFLTKCFQEAILEMQIIN